MNLPAAFESQAQTLLGNDYAAFKAALDTPSPISIRWNPKKVAQPTSNQVPWTDWAQYLDSRPVFTLDPAFHAGLYYVQEASSMLLEQVLKQAVDLEEDHLVLDLCAAPGGKSTHLLSLLSDDSLLVSNEVIRSRAGILAENLQKWGFPNMVITNNDPADFNRLSTQFDVLVVDAPCSGEGLFRKDPAAMQEWSTDNVNLCAARQQRILSDIWDSLRPGGVLIYSTCTYNALENEANLKWLSEQYDIEPIDIDLEPGWGFKQVEDSGFSGFHAYPHQVKGEGFYITAVRKIAGKHSSSPKIKKRHNYADKAQIKEPKQWLLKPKQFFFINHRETLIALPEYWHDTLLDINQSLNIVTEGLKMGEQKKKNIVPDPALALSTQLNTEAFNCIDLEKAEALRYLKKENLNFEAFEAGLGLIQYQGHGLGWGKRIQNRFNNYYPTNWRIRMEID